MRIRVYDPGQHGSASLKQVLPAPTGKDYSGLAIREGGQAGEEFKRVTFGDVGEEERRGHANVPRISPARRDTV